MSAPFAAAVHRWASRKPRTCRLTKKYDPSRVPFRALPVVYNPLGLVGETPEFGPIESMALVRNR